MGLNSCLEALVLYCWRLESASSTFFMVLYLFKVLHYSKKKNATPLLYRKPLLGWKTSYLQHKVKTLSLQLKLLLKCLLRTPRRISSCRMWGSRMLGLDRVSRAVRQNW